MTGYIKKIAVIKQLKDGFSADGGALSGIIKAETYAGFLKVEASFINFAHLSEGRYVIGITDGGRSFAFEGSSYEGEEPFDLSHGFGALVCFCHGGTSAPIASAVSGTFAAALPSLNEFMSEREETPQPPARYEDEAIAEENYYEYEACEDGGPVRKNEEKEGGAESKKDEADNSAFQKEQDGVSGLAGGDFYLRMSGEIKEIFSKYPRDEDLENAVEDSCWAKIDYGDGKFYSFGVLYEGGNARYLCYAVPARNGKTPPRSLEGCSTYVPAGRGGYWVLFQDAATGVSVNIKGDG